MFILLLCAFTPLESMASQVIEGKQRKAYEKVRKTETESMYAGLRQEEIAEVEAIQV
jgi:hypothetical protein